MSEQPPHEIIWTLTNAGVASRCLHVVAELGVADAMTDESVSAAELASASPKHNPSNRSTTSPWRRDRRILHRSRALGRLIVCPPDEVSLTSVSVWE
jgi:hypothetical protein